VIRSVENNFDSRDLAFVIRRAANCRRHDCSWVFRAEQSHSAEVHDLPGVE